MAATDVVDLVEAKRHLNITDNSADAELPVFISAASEAIEDYVGPVVQRSVTEAFDGGRDQVLLSHLPVVSITSVTVSGTVLDPSVYQVNTRSGVLTFQSSVESPSVVYVAGRFADTAAVSGRYKMAGLIIIQHLWETQRPAASGPFTQGSDDYDPRFTYSIPRRALEMLGEPIGGIA